MARQVSVEDAFGFRSHMVCSLGPCRRQSFNFPCPSVHRLERVVSAGRLKASFGHIRQPRACSPPAATARCSGSGPDASDDDDLSSRLTPQQHGPMEPGNNAAASARTLATQFAPHQHTAGTAGIHDFDSHSVSIFSVLYDDIEDMHYLGGILPPSPLGPCDPIDTQARPTGQEPTALKPGSVSSSALPWSPGTIWSGESHTSQRARQRQAPAAVLEPIDLAGASKAPLASGLASPVLAAAQRRPLLAQLGDSSHKDEAAGRSDSQQAGRPGLGSAWGPEGSGVTSAASTGWGEGAPGLRAAGSDSISGGSDSWGSGGNSTTSGLGSRSGDPGNDSDGSGGMSLLEQQPEFSSPWTGLPLNDTLGTSWDTLHSTSLDGLRGSSGAPGRGGAYYEAANASMEFSAAGAGDDGVEHPFGPGADGNLGFEVESGRYHNDNLKSWGPAMDLGGGWGGGYFGNPQDSGGSGVSDLSWSEWSHSSGRPGRSQSGLGAEQLASAATDEWDGDSGFGEMLKGFGAPVDVDEGSTNAATSASTTVASEDELGGYVYPYGLQSSGDAYMGWPDIRTPSRAAQATSKKKKTSSYGGASKAGSPGGAISGQGGGAGGGIGGGGKRQALRTEDQLRRATAAASISIPRMGAAVTIPLPPAHGHGDRASTAAPDQSKEPCWATTPLAYDFSQIYKLLGKGSLPEEMPLPEELVSLAAGPREASRAAPLTDGRASDSGSDSGSGGDGSEGSEGSLTGGSVSSEQGAVDDFYKDILEAASKAAARAKAQVQAKTPDGGQDESRKNAKGKAARGKGGKDAGGWGPYDAEEANAADSLRGCTAYRLPGGVEVVLVQNAKAVAPVVAWLRASLAEDMTMGIDTEWPPSCRSPSGQMALIQVATATRVALLHVAQMKRSATALGGPLYGLFADPSINWVGAAWTTNDQVKMAAAFSGEPPSMHVVDVQAAASAAGWPRVGLTGLAVDLLGVAEFSKSKNITMSNWAAAAMTLRQIRYAALDALLPPLLLRQLRLFAAMPGLRCAFCKQAMHAPSLSQRRPFPFGQAPKSTAAAPEVTVGTDRTPLDVAPSLVCDHCGRKFWSAHENTAHAGSTPAASTAPQTVGAGTAGRKASDALAVAPGDGRNGGDHGRSGVDGPPSAQERLQRLLLATHSSGRGRQRPRRVLFACTDDGDATGGSGSSVTVGPAGRTGTLAATFPASNLKAAKTAGKGAGGNAASTAKANKAKKKTAAKLKAKKVQQQAAGISVRAGRWKAVMQVFETDPELQAFFGWIDGEAAIDGGAGRDAGGGSGEAGGSGAGNRTS